MRRRCIDSGRSPGSIGLLRVLPGIVVLASLSVVAQPAVATPAQTPALAPFLAATDAHRPAARGERLADGSVFLPKPAQFALQLRTVQAERGEYRQRWQLAARLMPDPAFHAVIAAPQAGVLAMREPLAAGAPVRRGQLLAELVVSLAGAEQAAMRGDLAHVIQQVKVKEQEILVLEHRIGNQVQMAGELTALTQMKEELRALERRRDALERTLSRRIALRAPIDGVLAAAAWRDGERLEAGQTVFELLDPQRQWLEVTSFRPLPAGADPVARLPAMSVTGGAPAAAEESPGLTFVQAGVARPDGSIPWYFRIDTPILLSRQRFGAVFDAEVAVGDPRGGIALEQAAVVRASDGRQVIWVQEQAERFVARSVHPLPIDDGRWLISETDVALGERVVVRGAWMLSQFH